MHSVYLQDIIKVVSFLYIINYIYLFFMRLYIICIITIIMNFTRYAKTATVKK